MADAIDTIPRWAAGLGDDKWARIGELISAGWATMDIVRELEIPQKQVRSLQAHVRKCGPRRRLTQFAAFKDRLLGQIEEFGGDLVESLQVIARLAVSNETPPATQVRALEAMNSFVVTLQRMMGDEAREEQRRKLEDQSGGNVDAAGMVRKILEAYNVGPPQPPPPGGEGE